MMATRMMGADLDPGGASGGSQHGCDGGEAAPLSAGGIGLMSLIDEQAQFEISAHSAHSSEAEARSLKLAEIRSWQPSSTSSDSHDGPDQGDDDDDGTGMGLKEQQTAGAVGRLVVGNVGEEADRVSAGGGSSSSLPSVPGSSIASHASRLLGTMAPAQRRDPSPEHENERGGRAAPAHGQQHLQPVPPQRRDRAGEQGDDSTRSNGGTGGRPGSGGNTRPMGSNGGKRRPESPSTRPSSPNRGRSLARRPASPKSAVEAEIKSSSSIGGEWEVHASGGKGAKAVAHEENGDGEGRLSESASFDAGRGNSGGGDEHPEGSHASHWHGVAEEINGQHAMVFGGDGQKVQRRGNGLNLHSGPTAAAGSKGFRDAQPQLTPRGAKTELVALISEAMFGGNMASTELSLDSSVSSTGGEKSLEAVSKAIVAVEIASASQDPEAHITRLFEESGSVSSDIDAGQRGKLVGKAIMLFHMAFPDHDGDGNGSWRGLPVLTPSKSGTRMSGSDVAQSLRDKFQGSAEMSVTSPSNLHGVPMSPIVMTASPEAGCTDSWNISDFSINASLDSIRNMAASADSKAPTSVNSKAPTSVKSSLAAGSPTVEAKPSIRAGSPSIVMSPSSVEMKFSETGLEMQDQGLGGEIDSNGLPSPGRRVANEPLATVAEASEDRSGIEASMPGAAPGLGRKEKPSSRADEIEAAEESKHCEPEQKEAMVGVEGDADEDGKLEDEHLPATATANGMPMAFYLATRVCLMACCLAASLAGLVLHLSPSMSQEQVLVGLILEVFAVPALFLATVGIGMECVKDDSGWMELSPKDRLASQRIARNYLPYTMCVVSFSIHGAKLSESESSSVVYLGVAAMLAAALLPLPLIYLLTKHKRRSKRGGPGWFLGHSRPKSKVAVCAVVTLMCGVSLLSSGLSAAFHAYSNGALSAIAGNTSANAQDPGAMDAVFAAGFLLVVSGLGLGTTAFAVGSTLDIRLVRDHYVSICLPATVLSSAAVFSLVYCCLTLL